MSDTIFGAILAYPVKTELDVTTEVSKISWFFRFYGNDSLARQLLTADYRK